MNKTNYLIPIMQQHWACHCAKPHAQVSTYFRSDVVACQLLSNEKDQLLLNLALDTPDDEEMLYRFKNHRYYGLFENDRDVYALEFGAMTDWAVQITTAILTEILGMSVFQEIPVDFYAEEHVARR